MKKITIIGSGATGTLLAINLIKHSSGNAPLEINLVDKKERIGRGVAYSASADFHLCSPARRRANGSRRISTISRSAEFHARNGARQPNGGHWNIEREKRSGGAEKKRRIDCYNLELDN